MTYRIVFFVTYSVGTCVGVIKDVGGDRLWIATPLFCRMLLPAIPTSVCADYQVKLSILVVTRE